MAFQPKPTLKGIEKAFLKELMLAGPYLDDLKQKGKVVEIEELKIQILEYLNEIADDIEKAEGTAEQKKSVKDLLEEKKQTFIKFVQKLLSGEIEAEKQEFEQEVAHAVAAEASAQGSSADRPIQGGKRKKYRVAKKTRKSKKSRKARKTRRHH
jgi:CO dehydrogenase/acetyl-CoA synthase delta subunit